MTVRPAPSIRGVIRVPGDKSISHRAAILGALGEGRTVARGFLSSADTEATLGCLSALGVQWNLDGDVLTVEGVGLGGLREPADVLDCGNSGTTMRVLAGVLAGQPFLSVLTGDASLRSRPMERVATPLRAMGATVLTREGGLAPLVILGGALRPIRHCLPVASAQVKSAVLLAGLYAEGLTVVEEPAPSRDHTERLLASMGADVRREGNVISVSGITGGLAPLDLTVPGDLSAAAFWMVAAACAPGSEVTLPGVGVNPTRAGIIEALETMGATVEVREERLAGGEPVADIVVRASRLRGATFGGDLIPRLQDEIPALAVAAVFAEGRTEVRDAHELRVKESDRISALATGLRAMGARIEERPDGFVIEGTGALRGAVVESHGDHRLAMAFAIAGLLAEGETVVEGADSVAVSYPGFWDDMDRLRAGVY
ncbi:MAG TPA: 3-phosphoshikimate 1-carboxyvinyltransferase [Dehalococcoidia bacterium]|nr:3-phosphoshikimate 1-carboxyvinyltransferase [Dehalococcoidia bacterium]